MKSFIQQLLKEGLKKISEEDDVDWNAYEMLDEARHSVMSEFLSVIEREQPSEEKPLQARQPWEEVSFSVLQRQWEEYMKHGFVKPNYAKTIDGIERIFTINTFKVRANTELAGHSAEDPVYIWKEFLEGTKYDNENIDKFIEYLDYWFGDYITEPHGQLRISDYGLPKLEKLVFDIRKVHDVSKKLPILDRMLNVVHQRSDIANWFVEGGTSSLNKLSGEVN